MKNNNYNLLSNGNLPQNTSENPQEIGTKVALKENWNIETVTAISVGIVSTIIAILLKDKITKKDKYEVKPIYMQKNLINLKLNCIFRIDLMHYIYKQFKSNILKGRRDKNERESSNRRAYAYSNE